MAEFYLAIFVIGFALTAISLLMGFSGHGFGDGGHVGHGGDIGHGGDLGHGADVGHGGDVDGPRNLFHRSSGPSLVNFGTVTAFMTWFGGIGFLLTAYTRLLAIFTVGAALVGGVVGAGAIFLFMAKVLAPDQIPLDPSDYYLPGTLGRVTVTIPGGATGEIVYTQAGSRKTAAARGAGGQEIAKGTEVVVMRYERGIAYVRPWDQVAEDPTQDQRS